MLRLRVDEGKRVAMVESQHQSQKQSQQEPLSRSWGDRLVSLWYKPIVHPALYILLPLWFLFQLLAFLRRFAYRIGLKKSWQAPVPVVIVGNISVGGTGKTPLVAALAQFLRQQGYTPGIVSRGYGGKGPFPVCVEATSQAEEVGDEPLLLFQLTQVPVAVGANRQASIQLLLQEHSVDVIIADDGLQHYALVRDLEIVVVDGARQFGNQWCLPIGPLRESISRLKQVDFVVTNSSQMQQSKQTLFESSAFNAQVFDAQVLPVQWRKVADHTPISLANLQQGTCVAIAGIGNPKRFYHTVREQGIQLTATYDFPDHHAFQAEDIAALRQSDWLLMTEKDAMKMQGFVQPHWVYLAIELYLPAGFYDQLAIRFPAQVEYCRDK